MKSTTQTLGRRFRRLALVGVGVATLVAPSAAQAENPGHTEDAAGPAIVNEMPDVSSFSLPPGAMVQAPDTNRVDVTAATSDVAIAYKTLDPTSFSLPPGAMVPSFSLPPGAVVQVPDANGVDLAAPAGDLAGTAIAREVPDPSSFSLPPGALVPAPDTNGVDFGDFGLGAAAAAGGALLAVAAAYATSRRRRHSGSLSESHS